MTEFFNGDQNIQVNHSRKTVEFLPYDKELTLSFIAKNLTKLAKKIPDDYSVSFQGQNFNGLSETNISLIKHGGFIYCNYTNDFKPIKSIF